MSNTQITTAVRLANSLSKDISGNLLSGQEMRVVEYLQILRSVLDTLEEKLEAGNDFKTPVGRAKSPTPGRVKIPHLLTA